MISAPDRYAEAALRRECEAVAGCAEGSRNEQLNKSAHAVGSLVAAGVLSAERATSDLLAAAKASGLPEREARTTIRSGLRSAPPRAGVEPVGPDCRQDTPPKAKPQAPRPRPAPKADPSGFFGTRWASLLDPAAGKPWEMTFEALAARLARPIEAQDKRRLPAWSLATYEGNARGNATFQTASGCVLDLDHGNVTEAQLHEALAGLVYLGHTTWTSTPEAPRWRVLIPTCRPLDFEGYRRAVAWLARRFPEGTVDPASSKPAQVFFVPAARPGYQHLACSPGDCVRVLDPDNPEGMPGLVAGGMVALSLREFLSQPNPPREFFLDPLLGPGALAMVCGWRGIGKTLFLLSLALAGACGRSFLRWRPGTRAARVLYLDGELPRGYLLDCAGTVVRALGIEDDPGDRFRIAAYDCQPEDMANLADLAGQARIDELIAAHGSDLVILDSLSTLAAGVVENEAEAWEPIAAWLKRHRKAGRAVVLAHHVGKNGTQRGTSRREDLLDLSIQLRQPEDYQASDGARFEVFFSKARGLLGADAESFEARLSHGDLPRWEVSDPERDLLNEVAELTQGGQSQAKIAATIGRDRSRVSRLQALARKRGLL